MNSELIIAILGAIGAGVLFTFGVRAIVSTVVLEINSNPQDSYHMVTSFILRAMLFFVMAFLLIMLTHN